MDKQAYLEEVYNEAHNEEFEKIAISGGKIQRAVSKRMFENSGRGKGRAVEYMGSFADKIQGGTSKSLKGGERNFAKDVVKATQKLTKNKNAKTPFITERGVNTHVNSLWKSLSKNY